MCGYYAIDRSRPMVTRSCLRITLTIVNPRDWTSKGRSCKLSRRKSQALIQHGSSIKTRVKRYSCVE